MVMLEEDLAVKPAERDLIGRTYARVEIPLTSALAIRDAADMLRGLANELDFCSRQQNVREVSKLLTARFSIDSVRRRLRERGVQDERMYLEEAEAKKKKAHNDDTYNGHTVDSHNSEDRSTY